MESLVKSLKVEVQEKDILVGQVSEKNIRIEYLLSDQALIQEEFRELRKIYKSPAEKLTIYTLFSRGEVLVGKLGVRCEDSNPRIEMRVFRARSYRDSIIS